MPIRVVCPSCSKVLKAPDTLAGKRAKCPACRGRVKVPEQWSAHEQSTDNLDEVDPFDEQEAEPAVSFTCHRCKAVLGIDGSMVGRQTVCPSCNTVLLVPDPNSASKPAPQAEREATTKAVSPSRPSAIAYHVQARQRKQQKQTMLIAGMIGAAVLFFLVAVGIRFLNRESPVDRNAKVDRDKFVKNVGKADIPKVLNEPFLLTDAGRWAASWACYLALYVPIAIWVMADASSRRIDGTIWAVGTVALGFVVLPFYFAKRPLKAGELREGGTAWNVLKGFAVLWTITTLAIPAVLVFVIFRVVIAVASPDQPFATALSLGAAAWIAGICAAVWFFPMLCAVLLGYFLKQNSIIERGPTGPLAVAFSRTNP